MAAPFPAALKHMRRKKRGAKREREEGGREGAGWFTGKATNTMFGIPLPFFFVFLLMHPNKLDRPHPGFRSDPIRSNLSNILPLEAIFDSRADGRTTQSNLLRLPPTPQRLSQFLILSSSFSFSPVPSEERASGRGRRSIS